MPQSGTDCQRLAQDEVGKEIARNVPFRGDFYQAGKEFSNTRFAALYPCSIKFFDTSPS